MRLSKSIFSKFFPFLGQLLGLWELIFYQNLDFSNFLYKICFLKPEPVGAKFVWVEPELERKKNWSQSRGKMTRLRNTSIQPNNLFRLLAPLTLIRVASKPTLMAWLVGILILTEVGLLIPTDIGILIPTDVGILIPTPQCHAFGFGTVKIGKNT